jgi:hypothetical protein
MHQTTDNVKHNIHIHTLRSHCQETLVIPAKIYTTLDSVTLCKKSHVTNEGNEFYIK